MRKAVGFLFPWNNTFKRLELEKRWWHRLAVVLFFVLLIPPFAFSWVIENEVNAPPNTVVPRINYWAILPPPPNGTGADNSSGAWEPVPTSTPNPQSTTAGDSIGIYGHPPPGATIGARRGGQAQTQNLPALDMTTSVPLPPRYTIDDTPTSGGDVIDQAAAEMQETDTQPDLSASDRGKVVMPLASVPLVSGHHVRVRDQRKTVEMPNGKTATFGGDSSDEAIKAEWKHQLDLALTKAALIGFGMAILATAGLSYLLQAAYRAVLYVIYGARAYSDT
jgi:hypothetical protein